MSEYIRTATNEREPQMVPSLAENMATMSERLSRLEVEAQAIAGTSAYPKWWYEGTEVARTVKKQLQDPTTDPQFISDYLQLSEKNKQLRSVITDHDDDASVLSTVVYELGAATVARGFKGETTQAPIHAALFDRLSGVDDIRDGITDELEVLREAYDTSSLTGLLGIRGDEYTDSLRLLLRTKHVVGLVRYTEQVRNATDTLEERQAKTSEWMAHALSAATGIDKTEAADYVFAASRRGEDESIIRILNKFDTFGVDRLRALSKFSGIHAFETCSDSQLELMELVMSDPESAAEYLSQHDVTVAMVNRFGDHNGILADVAETFEDKSKRTLIFEIARISDIMRHMHMLRDANIKPSTVVLAAHTAPGQFFVSDFREPERKRDDIATIAGKGLVQLVNNGNVRKGTFSYPMHGIEGVARVVENLMQPSRAIDDSEEDAGRKKIIFLACDAATEVEIKDIDAHGNKVTVGTESIVSQLGKELITHGVTSNVDIYGAPASIQAHKTGHGVRFTKQPGSWEGDRQPQHAIRARVENGVISQQQVDEIIMHK
jgi:hypothetical protein